MSFNEPIEQRFNDLLKQRVALEGELALLRKNQTETLAAERRGFYKILLIVLLLPLLTFLCKPKVDPSVLTHQIAEKRDSIDLLLGENAHLSATRKASVKYVIKQGDMLVSLGYLFYNDSTAGYQIGRDNGLKTEQQHRKLTVGDTLTVNFR
jgi:hypothetical protein